MYWTVNTCPIDNILFGPKPYRCPFTVRAKILRPALGLPCSYHALAMEPLLVCCRPSYDTNSIPALVRPTTSSYTRQGPFGHDTPSFCRGSQRIWLPSVGPGNGMETASSPPLYSPVPSTGNYHEPLTPGVGSGTGYRRSPFPASAGLVLVPFVLGLSHITPDRLH